jgi:tetratricopeptide (TPR) repeat protein
LTPPENYWWWFIKPQQQIDKIDEWDQFDWVFNFLSLALLAGFASLTSQIIPMIFSGGLGIGESVGLMGPGALLSVVGSNIKGGESRDKFLKNMEKIGVPPRFCSEVTCLLAAVLFGGAYIARQVLPSYYFNQFVSEGIKLYKSSRLIPAKEQLTAALKLPDLDPKEVGKVYNYIGLIEESVGKNSEAIEAYNRAVLLEEKSSMSNISRVYITKGDLLTAESYLKIGLQRTSNDTEKQDHVLQYNLHRNLGWVYLEGKRYKDAEMELNIALKISDKYLLNEVFFGQGMASCFLGYVYEQTNRSNEAVPIWNNCRSLAKPETIAEYRTLVKLKPELAGEIDTKGLF